METDVEWIEKWIDEWMGRGLVSRVKRRQREKGKGWEDRLREKREGKWVIKGIEDRQGREKGKK